MERSSGVLATPRHPGLCPPSHPVRCCRRGCSVAVHSWLLPAARLPQPRAVIQPPFPAGLHKPPRSLCACFENRLVMALSWLPASCTTTPWKNENSKVMTQQGSRSRPSGASCPLLPRAPGCWWGPPGGCGGRGGRCGEGEPLGSACLEALMGWGGAGWGGHQVSGVPRGDGSLRATSAPSPSPLQRPACAGSPQPAGTSLHRALRAAWADGASCCWQLQLRTLARLRRHGGCRGAEGLLGPRAGDARSCRAWQAPLGTAGPAPARRGCAGDRNSWGGPLPYLTPHSTALYCPALAGCPRHGALPSLCARWLMAIPWRWTPTGVSCQG